METFLLNMQLLSDAFSSVYQHVTLFSDSDPARLEAVRLYDRNRPLGTSYLYLLYSEQLIYRVGNHEQGAEVFLGIRKSKEGEL